MIETQHHLQIWYLIFIKNNYMHLEIQALTFQIIDCRFLIWEIINAQEMKWMNVCYMTNNGERNREPKDILEELYCLSS